MENAAMMYLGRIAIVTAAAVAAACGGGNSIGGLDVEQSYNIALTTAAEVPAPTQQTSASGTAQLVVFPTSIDFLLSATAITGITMAHIHSGAVGVAGPVVLTLFLPSAPTGAVNGVFALGTINAANLPSGVTMESLKTLLLSGNSYINVHTSANQTGEIRGQIK